MVTTCDPGRKGPLPATVVEVGVVPGAAVVVVAAELEVVAGAPPEVALPEHEASNAAVATANETRPTRVAIMSRIVEGRCDESVRDR
jgi:hypothetical protein